MSNRFTKTALVSIGTLVFSLLLVSACCDKGSLRLRRISAFLSGVFEVAFELEIDGYASFDFDGDAGDWARIPAFDGARIATDLSAAAFSRQQAGYDVDWDAVDETIRLVLAENADPDIPDLLLIQWGGDAYTADKGVCYLGWTEQGQVKIAASHCDDDIGVMYCRMSQGSDGPAICEGCYTGQACQLCDMKKSLNDCLPSSSDGSSVDVDVDIDIDIDMDIDLDLDVDNSETGKGW